MEQLNILVVDDVEINCRLIEAYGLKGGYKTDIALSGQDAIGRIGEKAYDLVLMDIQMPEMNGIEAANRIHEIRPDQPVFALSASDSEDSIAGYDQARWSGYLNKPISMADIETVVGQFAKATAA